MKWLVGLVNHPSVPDPDDMAVCWFIPSDLELFFHILGWLLLQVLYTKLLPYDFYRFVKRCTGTTRLNSRNASCFKSNKRQSKLLWLTTAKLVIFCSVGMTQMAISVDILRYVSFPAVVENHLQNSSKRNVVKHFDEIEYMMKKYKESSLLRDYCHLSTKVSTHPEVHGEHYSAPPGRTCDVIYEIENRFTKYQRPQT